MNNDDLLKKFGELIDQKLESVKRDMATKADVERLEQGQQELKQDVADVKQDAARTNTALDAVGAGVRELREIVATKVDVMDVGVKVDKLRKRIEGLEETEGITHKN